MQYMYCMYMCLHTQKAFAFSMPNEHGTASAGELLCRPSMGLSHSPLISRLLLKGAQYVTVVVRHSPTITLHSICHTSSQYVIFFTATLLRHCSPRINSNTDLVFSHHCHHLFVPQDIRPFSGPSFALLALLCVYTVQVLHEDAQMKYACATERDGVCPCSIWRSPNLQYF